MTLSSFSRNEFVSKRRTAGLLNSAMPDSRIVISCVCVANDFRDVRESSSWRNGKTDAQANNKDAADIKSHPAREGEC